MSSIVKAKLSYVNTFISHQVQAQVADLHSFHNGTLQYQILPASSTMSSIFASIIWFSEVWSVKLLSECSSSAQPAVAANDCKIDW